MPVLRECHISEQLKKSLAENGERLWLPKYGKVEPIIGMENPYYYRNKIHAVFDRDRKGNIVSEPMKRRHTGSFLLKTV
ncbi:MAG: hypothetical protein ACLR2O_02415 [Coprococcus sp.]